MIFVTGGTGLLGMQLLYDLTSQGNQVRALYRSESRQERVRDFFNYRDSENAQAHLDRIDWVEGDILDVPRLLEVLSGCAYVYHCAALVSFHPKDHARLFKINREGTENVVNACLEVGITKLCYVSSTAAIGGDDTAVITEATKWISGSVTSSYSLSKYGGEREIWRGIEEGLTAVIVNPSVIFGPGDWNESSLTIFKTLERGLTYYPTGGNATVDVRDVSKAMIALMQSEIHSERFLCVGSNQSFERLMTSIANALGTKPPKKPVSKSVVNFVRIFMSLGKGILGKRSNITRETVSNLFATKTYDTTKIQEAIGIQFHTLEEQIEDAVRGRLN